MSADVYERPLETACPHDGWYNGNIRLMKMNGTYADFRFRFVEWVRKGKMSQVALDQHDKEWQAIPLEERKARRAKVLEDTKQRPVKLRDGKIEMVSSPSDNGSAAAALAPKLHKPLRPTLAPGALASRPDPLAAEEAALALKSTGATLAAVGQGSPVPETVPAPPTPVTALPAGHAIPSHRPASRMSPAMAAA